MIGKFPKLLDLLAPVTYIYIQRQDKVAQAVSMAKATQTGAWVAQAKANTANLNYDRDLISKCLNFLERAGPRLGAMVRETSYRSICCSV